MRLYYSHTSPFARKVIALLYVSGLIDRCELALTTFESEELRALNPLGKIPALENGSEILFDSTLICEYLDKIIIDEGQSSLFHAGHDDYFSVQKMHYAANGITEAAIATVMELRRETEKSDYWLDRWHTAIKTGVKTTATTHLAGGENPTIGTIAFAACLGYLDFRLPELGWRAWNLPLAQWFEDVSDQEWFTRTAPPSA